MRIKSLIAAAMLLWPVSASADAWQRWTPLGYCQLAVTSSAVQTSTCTGGIPAGAVWAYVCNEGTAARYRDDGTAPTASIGVPLATGTATAPACASYYGTLANLQWIAESGTATLDISFYK